MQPKRQPGASRAPAKVLPDSPLRIPPAPDHAVEKNVDGGIAGESRDPLAFGLYPQLVVIPTVPPLRVPGARRTLLRITPFELIEHHFAETMRVVHLHHGHHFLVSHVAHHLLRRVGWHVVGAAVVRLGSRRYAT